MTEKQLASKVKDYLKTVPNLWFFHTGGCWMVGLPDYIICYKRRFITAELKREGKGLRKIQRYVMGKIRKAGGETMVIYNIEDIKGLIEGGN